MCDKVTLGNGKTSRFVPNCYKNQKKSNKATDNNDCALL